MWQRIYDKPTQVEKDLVDARKRIKQLEEITNKLFNAVVELQENPYKKDKYENMYNDLMTCGSSSIDTLNIKKDKQAYYIEADNIKEAREQLFQTSDKAILPMKPYKKEAYETLHQMKTTNQKPIPSHEIKTINQKLSDVMDNEMASAAEMLAISNFRNIC